MLAQAASLTSPSWQTLAVALVGVTSAALTLLLAFILARRPQQPRDEEVLSVPSRPPERRTLHRRRGNPVKVLLTDADAQGNPQEAWVVDRSLHGLCLRVEGEQILPGTVLSVRSASAPKAVPWTRVEVKHCRPDGNAWELGCQFLKTPSWSVLLLFG